jgi:hypothetical protein
MQALTTTLHSTSARPTDTPGQHVPQTSERQSRRRTTRGKDRRSLPPDRRHAEKPQIELIEAAPLGSETIQERSDPESKELNPRDADDGCSRTNVALDEPSSDKMPAVTGVPEQSETK